MRSNPRRENNFICAIDVTGFASVMIVLVVLRVVCKYITPWRER